MIQAIHTAVKGRARYKVQPLYRSESLKKYLEQRLSAREAIQQVSANPLTGNVLVRFNRDLDHDRIASWLEAVVTDFQQQGETAPTQPRQPVEEQEQRSENWYLMEIDAVLDAWNTSRESGLSSEAAAENLNQYGSNVLSESEPRSDLSIWLDQFNSLPVALLGAAAGLSIFTGGLADAVVIAGVVGVNAAIGYVTESESEKIIRSLKTTETPSVRVIRDGERREMNAEDLVPGDLIVLQAGSYVPADVRLLETSSLSIDESALTGESIPVSKKTEPLTQEDAPLGDRKNMAYKGTLVTGGEGLAVVVATGKFTEMGKIQAMVSEAEETETPLQKQLDEAGSQLVLISGGVCGLVFGIGLLRGYGFLQMLKTAISLAVAAVPEGLPTVATTTLALGIRDMREHNILIRGLNAVEALGSVQTICLDKTGTITQNKMVVEEVHIPVSVLKLSEGQFLTDEEKTIDPEECEELAKLIQVSVLCSESEVKRGDDGEYEVRGSATENALIDMAIEAGTDAIALREDYPRVRTIPRDERRNVMTTVHRAPEGKQFVAVKGAPGEVLERCRWQMREGEIVSLANKDRRDLELENDRMAGKALRVLGVAYTFIDEGEELETDLTWLGLTGMADPIREGVQDLMEQFHRAGIKTVMITGDQSPTAYAIAKSLNLSRDRKLEILDSSDLANIDPETMTALFDKVDVFARISPADKLQIVQALQGAGKIVAMTGDGINDTPALKAANIGVGMGQGGGAHVVREVADVIIEDNNLQTIINAVSQGRTTYNNIRKSVHFLLATNMSEIIVTTVAVAAGLGEPLNAMQLLWLNLVTDVFPGLALALEPPEADVLDRPPRDPDEPIIKASDFERIAFESSAISLSALSAYGYGILKYGQGPQASTIAFMSLTVGQILHTLSCRSEEHTLLEFDQLPHNPYMDGAIIGSLAIQLLPATIPGLRNLLNLAPIDPLDCLVIGGSALLPLVVNESTKHSLQGETQ